MKARIIPTSLRFCGLRFITMSDGLTATLTNGMNGLIGTDFAIRRLVKENANIELKSLASPKTVIDLNQSKGKMKHRNETTRSRE